MAKAKCPVCGDSFNPDKSNHDWCNRCDKKLHPVMDRPFALSVNQPFERLPQHASDPGHGPVPPESNVVWLRNVPEEKKS